jgi:NADH:ubiquinone oxidoreductase subunit F (NADH-binding)
VSGVPHGPVLALALPDRQPGQSTEPLRLLDQAVVFPDVGHGDPAWDPRSGLAGHLATYGQRPSSVPLGPEDLVEAVAGIGLTGRGGGHFPAATKWQAVREATRRTGVRPIVVANAAEGEPASAKDAALLCRRPHLVLDGLALAAEAVGATEGILWLHGEAHEAHRVLVRALQERRAHGLLEPTVRLATGPSHYLTGESSALVRALSGGPALPESHRVPTAVEGVDGRPTLVHNVETLARIGLLARTGVDEHRSTVLVTVLTGGRRTVVELDRGTSVSAALLLGGWPAGEEPLAVLLGGYGGSWLSWDRVRSLPLDETSMRAAGTSIGAGVLAPLPHGTCGVAEVARVAAYLANSSARQCGPCLFGLSAISAALTALRRGTGRRSDVRRLQLWAEEVDGRGACHHPDGAVRMALTGLVAFADDVEAHRRHRPCAGADGPGLLPVPGEGS